MDLHVIMHQFEWETGMEQLKKNQVDLGITKDHGAEGALIDADAFSSHVVEQMERRVKVLHNHARAKKRVVYFLREKKDKKK